MNSKNRLFAIVPIAIGIVLAMILGACSVAPDMDEVIVDTEINAPSDPEQGGGGGDDLPPSLD